MRRLLLVVAPAVLLVAPLHAQDQATAIGAPRVVASPVLLEGPRAGPALPRLQPGAVAIPVAGFAVAGSAAAPDDTLRRQQRRVVRHSDFYYRRLTVHRWASYATVPLFVAQYVAGERLIDRRAGGEDDDDDAMKGVHGALAGAVGGLFVVNTVTGAWNWWDDRHVAQGRTRRTVHAIAMLVADAGFVATAATADGIEDEYEGEREGGSANTHRNIAIGSMSLALASTALMWFWKD